MSEVRVDVISEWYIVSHSQNLQTPSLGTDQSMICSKCPLLVYITNIYHPFFKKGQIWWNKLWEVTCDSKSTIENYNWLCHFLSWNRHNIFLQIKTKWERGVLDICCLMGWIIPIYCKMNPYRQSLDRTTNVCVYVYWFGKMLKQSKDLYNSKLLSVMSKNTLYLLLLT